MILLYYYYYDFAAHVKKGEIVGNWEGNEDLEAIR